MYIQNNRESSERNANLIEFSKEALSVRGSTSFE